MKRYSAKLLFQSRIEKNEKPERTRLCEERIIVLQARGPRDALRRTQASGRRKEFTFVNVHGQPVHFEFIGVTDIMCIEDTCSSDEVWFEWKKLTLPMENREKHIPTDEQLLRSIGD